jgi:hypothetical protein
MILTCINMVGACVRDYYNLTGAEAKERGEYSKAKRTEPRPHQIARNNWCVKKVG